MTDRYWPQEDWAREESLDEMRVRLNVTWMWRVNLIRQPREPLPENLSWLRHSSQPYGQAYISWRAS